MKNPFVTKVLDPTAPFCNRLKEQEELIGHAQSGMNVVVFSPRRFGKTSLVLRVQHELKCQGFCAFYADFFKATSVEDVAARIARSVYQGLHRHESLLNKGKRWLGVIKSFRPVMSPTPDGSFSISVEASARPRDPMQRLNALMREFGEIIGQKGLKAHVVLDEFQDLADLREPRVEAVLRSHIQHQQASFFFLGSRRRVLLDIFNNQGRPFFQSALMFELKSLPLGELSEFIQERFKQGGKKCSLKTARALAGRVEQHPYYAQALAYRAFAASGDECALEDVEAAFDDLVQMERFGYEAAIQNLSAKQVELL
ncbi:MAG: ATP-binding protein, partial [Thermodesulfobacteriota bacterium]|nr:ATP-binding protein [Thermodesulfobacteriota bacterium]